MAFTLILFHGSFVSVDKYEITSHETIGFYPFRNTIAVGDRVGMDTISAFIVGDPSPYWFAKDEAPFTIAIVTKSNVFGAREYYAYIKE